MVSRRQSFSGKFTGFVQIISVITGRGREGRALEFSPHLRCLRAWSRLVCPVSISLSHEQNATLRCQGTLQRESRPCRLLGVEHLPDPGAPPASVALSVKWGSDAYYLENVNPSPSSFLLHGGVWHIVGAQ